MGEVLESQVVQIFEAMNGKAIWTSAIRIGAISNRLRNNIWKEEI